MLLSYNELVKLVDSGVISAPIKNINGSSIDLTLHHIIRREVIGSSLKTIKLYKRESINTEEIDMLDNGEYVMMPDSVLLGATVECFNMPLDLSAEFSLKSTLGRNYLEHMLAGWIDPGFNGTLTLELKNGTQFHKLAIAPGMKIGQVKFFRHSLVPNDESYVVKGQYNGQIKVTPSKGIR
jgi:dCTP deaminase